MKRISILWLTLWIVVFGASFALGSGFMSGGGVTFPLLGSDGAVGAPTYSFASAPTSGAYYSGGCFRIAILGTQYNALCNGTDYVPSGTSTSPGITDINVANVSGLSWSVSTNSLSVLNNNLETVRWDATGRQYFKRQTAVPTMGACGTSPSVTVGADNVMLVTTGTGGIATSCAVNFGAAYITNPPVCIAQNDTDRVAYSIATSTTVVTITATAAFTASSKFHVLCFGAV